jgi:hypothetical protein
MVRKKSFTFFETRHAEVFLRGGILEAYFKPRVHITINDSREFQKKVEKICDRPLPVFYDVRDIGSFDIDSVHSLRSDYSMDMINSLAILVRPLQFKLILFIKLYLLFNRIRYPVALFTDKQKALEWLSFFVGKKIQ